MRKLLALMLLLLAACGMPTNATPGEASADAGSTVVLPSGPATIIGQITSLENGSMQVEENPGQPNNGRKIVFRLSDTTVIGERVGDNIEARTQTDLQSGQRVAAWVDGPLAESFPEQGSAAAVVISIPAPSGMKRDA